MRNANLGRMNLGLLLPVALFLVGLHVSAQQPPSDNESTAGFLNGRFWDKLDANTKVAFYLGLIDGIRTGALHQLIDGVKYRQTIDTYVAKNFTNGDHVKELDKLYSERENILIPIPFALAYCVLKLGGSLSKGELEQKLIEIRRYALTENKSGARPMP